MITAATKAVWPWIGVAIVWSLPLIAAVVVIPAAVVVWFAAYTVMQHRNPHVRTRLHRSPR